MPTTLTRSLLVVLIPGGIAAAPWLVLFVFSRPEVLDYYKAYPTVGNTLAFAVFVVIGSSLEGINTFIEVQWDKAREHKYKVAENWFDYLGKTCASEPVGFRYVSRLATSMYFELSMIWASASLWVGAATWSAATHQTACPGAVIFALVAVVSAVYFYWQAHNTHRVLCEAREEILKRM